MVFGDVIASFGMGLLRVAAACFDANAKTGNSIPKHHPSSHHLGANLTRPKSRPPFLIRKYPPVRGSPMVSVALDTRLPFTATPPCSTKRRAALFDGASLSS